METKFRIGKRAFGADYQVIEIFVFRCRANDKMGWRKRKNQTNHVHWFMRKVNKYIKIKIHKIMNLYFLRFTIPIQILITEIVGRELLQAIERDFLVIDVTKHTYGAVG